MKRLIKAKVYEVFFDNLLLFFCFFYIYLKEPVHSYNVKTTVS